jgi:hypothetical protein
MKSPTGLLWVGSASLALAGCLSPGAALCGDGVICPADSRCDVQHHRCVTAAEEAACVDLADGASCTLIRAPGVCTAGACVPRICGDNARYGTESCDGTDLGGKTCADLGFYGQTTGLACATDCTFDTRGCVGKCGDKVRNGSEQCDGSDLGGADCRTMGFYDSPGLRCSPTCTLDLSACTGLCGDAITNGPEQCDGKPPLGMTCHDFGYDRGLLACSATCAAQLDGCEEIGWKDVPSLQQRMFTGAWGSGPNDVFAVGTAGTIVRWDGTTWSPMSSGTTADLESVWGTGPNDVFAVGGAFMTGPASGTILHWDGKTWSPMSPPASNVGGYLGVWGSGPSDVYAVGSQISHWDGMSWSAIGLGPSGPSAPPSGPAPPPGGPGLPTGYRAVWGSGRDDVFVGGGGVAHWDGKSWSTMSTGDVEAIWGSGPQDVFTIGGSQVLHWNGASWSDITPALAPPTYFYFYTVWGTGPNDVLVTGVDTRLDVGGPRIVRWNGTSWSSIAAPTTLGSSPIGHSGGIWGSGPDDIFIASHGIEHSNGDGWSRMTVAVDVGALWAPGPDDLFAVGESGLMGPGVARITGMHSSASVLIMLAPDTLAPFDVWGSAEDDVFFVAYGSLRHWDGLEWTVSYPEFPPVGVPSMLVAGVWGSGRTDAYAVGTPASASDLAEPCSAGHAGLVMRWDGSRWSMPATITDKCLSSVWGSGADDVFAVGEAGTIVHWDGASWSAMSSGSTEALSSVWGSGPKDVYAVGAAGTILRFDGTKWSPMSSGTTVPLLRVRGSGAGDVFVAGARVLLHLRTGVWEDITLPSDFSASALWVTPSRVLLGGGTEILSLDRNSVTCVGPEQNCSDGWDDDCDGLADGADPDCAGKVIEQCANGVDDDQNGLVDCADPACGGFPACKTR